MLKTAVRLTPTFIIPLFGNRNECDYNLLEQQAPNVPKTGWERVKKMYSLDEYDEISVELNHVLQTSFGGAFIGGTLGGFTTSREAYLYFIENNQATIFKSPMQAKKRLQDYVMVGFAKGAYRWGWRLGAFTGMFSLIATTISVYYDDTTLVEYIAAGAITGGLYKANLGTAAMCVGAALGATLSAIAGSLVLGILKVTGLSMKDIRKALYRIIQAREEQYSQAIEKVAEIKNDDLTRHHEKMIEEKGTQNIADLK